MSKNKKARAHLPVWVSQNYLTSSQTIQKLMRRTSLNQNDHVIEIGPGKGHITLQLTKTCNTVTAIEIDKCLYEKLKVKLMSEKNLNLKNQNFLTWQLPSYGSYKVFSNIPFNITSDIVRKLTECRNPPTEAWLVMEKGAAKRFMGNTKESLQSLLIKPYFEMEVVYYFSREDFHPKPSVDTVLVYIKKKAKPDMSPIEKSHWKRFVSKGLQQGLAQLLSKKQLKRALAEAGLPIDFTPGHLRYIQWLCLFRCWQHHGRH